METGLLQRSDGGTESGPPSSRRVSRMDLPARQRMALDYVVQYYRATQEPCPAAFVARRMNIEHSTVREHFLALHRKGWLRSSNTPAVPTRW